MEQLYITLISIGVFLCSGYVILIASYCYGWIKTKKVISENDASVFVSIVIAARNEENSIIGCLDAIRKQSYPSDKFEVVIVDDASEDATNQLIREYSIRFPFIKLITFSAKGECFGKKNAIRTGIGAAKGELIVTTDADCIMGKDWLSSVVSCYQTTNAQMIVAPVCFHNEKSVFEKMQSLEFMALIACGGASLYYHKAIMCNGANLAYSKKVFDEVNGFDGIDKRSSGDDVLLMYKIKEKYPKGIVFLKEQNAIVYTMAKNSLKEFVDQRKRWASKGFFMLNTETKVVSMIIYLLNFALVFLPVVGYVCFRNTIFYHSFIEICLILIIIKCFIDFLLLFLSASFFKKRRLLLYFLPEQFIYMLYITIVGLIGTIGKYEWKGRKLN